jgi:uncharacterized membrane protein (UPF0127 family)
MRSLRVVLIALFATACGARAQVAGLEDLSAFPQGTVIVEARTGVHRFGAWIADTPRRQAQGLMYVRDLPAARAMVFPHDPPRPVSMWMKNTFIELDMVFVADGRIVKIVSRARPHSLQTIGTQTPVSAVIELRGGEAERQSLQVGDPVRIERAP